MTDAERTLLLLLADALWEVWVNSEQAPEIMMRLHNARADVAAERRHSAQPDA